jgi:hypothetical protein
MQHLQHNAQKQTDAVSDELPNLQMENQELNGKSSIAHFITIYNMQVLFTKIVQDKSLIYINTLC